jgi:GAF domain-containing protein
MSQAKRKYKLIEAFFSRIRPAAPDSPAQAAAGTAAVFGPPTAAPPAGSWQDFFSGAERGRKTGFIFDRGKVTSLEETSLPLPENALSVPLTVSGKTIGVIQAAGSETGWPAQEIEIVSAVAAQLARHLENLHFLEQNEKHTQEC